MQNMQYDSEFLLKLDKSKNKTIYARITALQFNESPIETIEGRVTGGSINIDGSSAIRRSCSLTMVAQDFNYNDYYWGLKTKFKLEIGVENNVDPSMPPVIWFNQGIYLITAFNTSRATNNFTISITGKDKMCLLNGELGGSLESSVDFGNIEEENEQGIWEIKPIPIPEIIRNAVHTYAGEPYWNIIINDLETYGLELLEYRYDIPMYLYKPPASVSNYYYNTIIENDSTVVYIYENSTMVAKKLSELESSHLDLLVDALDGGNHTAEYVYVRQSEKSGEWKDLCKTIGGHTYVPYNFAKVEFGQTAGYRITDLTYAGELVANIGESITSVLDKIKNMLVEFEYFYDVDGRFVFQKKQSFVSTMWQPLSTDDEGNAVTKTSSPLAYMFSAGELITAFNNNPNLANMKNDYSVWGERTGVSGAKIPVHLRYAIDTKPTFYRTYDGSVFYTTEKKSDADLRQEIEDELELKYKKKPNPNGLPEDWWDIFDWAEYYKRLTGEYPTGRMSEYCDEAADKSIDLNAYFAAPQKPPQGNSGVWKNQQNIYIFDVNADNTLGYYGHFNGCSHYYSYFLNQADLYGGTSYIYKPHIPQKDIADLENKIEEIMLSRRYNQDWREIIYRMAKDYYKHNTEDDFEITLSRRNYPLYPTGQTGYEKYYIDIAGFWRQLFDPELDLTIAKREKEVERLVGADGASGEIGAQKNLISTTEKKIITDHAAGEDVSQLKIDLQDYNNKLDLLELELDEAEIDLQKALDNKENYYYEDTDGDRKFWLRNVYEAPETLNFWFDFLDTEGELQQFSVKNVGSRSKAINDTAIKSIYFRETPAVVFTKDIAEEGNQLPGYRYIQIPESLIDEMFTISAQGKSAKDKLDELLYQHGYCIESATITAIPIYYLQPNVRVHLYDEDTGLDGDYVVSKITLPLTYNGTMSLTATKAAESIL